MTDLKATPFTATRLAEPAIDLRKDEKGVIRITSRLALPDYPQHLLEHLFRWEKEAPDRLFLAERSGDGWREVSYRAMRQLVDGVAQGLLERGITPDRPVMCLSDNGINHAILMFAAMRVGIPFVPVSPAYSLMSSDFAKVRQVYAAIRPSVVYVSQAAPFAKCLGVLDLSGVTVVQDKAGDDFPHIVGFDALTGAGHMAEVEAIYRTLNADTVAKILLTSGSTGVPKGVINTHRMMCSNMAALAATWQFLADRPPVIVDWLPWNHTFGTNFNLNQIMAFGGSMYIDAGKPMPGRIEQTIANLRAVAPTLLFNVPRGFDALLPIFEKDDALAKHVFGNLDVIFYAGASLPQAAWDRLEALSVKARGQRVPILTALGSTETAPCATVSHWGSNLTGTVGLPMPGVEAKLVPDGAKLEIRLKGPCITPGYYNLPELTEKAFDEEGFFKLGDAVKFMDPDSPVSGLVFDGRVAENFKLMSGVWVHVGTLRVQAISAASPLIGDAVVTGAGEEEVGLLVFPNVVACRGLCGPEGAELPLDAVLRHPEVRAAVQAGLAGHNAANPGSSTQITRVLMMTEPPSVDANEITDKGYINQRAVLERRKDLVARLYAETPDPDVILVGRSGGKRAA
jgi:feruloyl-CoA synthase